MKILFIVIGVIAALMLLGWLGLQIKPKPLTSNERNDRLTILSHQSLVFLRARPGAVLALLDTA